MKTWLAGLLLALVAGCSGAAGSERTVPTQTGRYRVAYTLSTETPTHGEAFGLDVQLLSVDGSLVPSLELQVGASSAADGRLATDPAVVEVAPALWHVEGLVVPDAGRWSLLFVFASATGAFDQAEDVIDVR